MQKKGGEGKGKQATLSNLALHATCGKSGSQLFHFPQMGVISTALHCCMMI